MAYSLSDAELDALIAHAEEVFARAMRKALRAASEQLAAEAGLTAALDPVGGGLGPEDIIRAREVWARQVPGMVGEVAGAYGASANAAAVAIYNKAPTGWVAPPPPPTGQLIGEQLVWQVADGAGLPLVAQFAIDSNANRYLSQAANRLVGVGDTSWRVIRDQLREGFVAGEGIDKISARLRGMRDISERRARTIARTEVVGASNHGAMAGAASLPGLEPEFKTWLSTLDGRTREDHARANGQKVPFAEPFTVGSWKMMHPHAFGAPAEEVVNCRCTVTFSDPAAIAEARPEPPSGWYDARSPTRPHEAHKAVRADTITRWKKFKGTSSSAPMENVIGFRHHGVSIITEVTPLTSRKLDEIGSFAERIAHLRNIRPDIGRAMDNIDELFKVHGNAVNQLRQVMLSSQANPADAYWAQRYGMRGFRSAATGGYQHMTIYGESGVNFQTMSHELGHVIDAGTSGYTTTNLGTTAAWRAAQEADAAFYSASAQVQRDTRYWTGDAIGHHRPTPGNLNGVSTYGQEAVAEDVAEAFRLLTISDQTGALTQSGLTFGDIWPNRERVLRDLIKKASRSRART